MRPHIMSPEMAEDKLTIPGPLHGERLMCPLPLGPKIPQPQCGRGKCKRGRDGPPKDDLHGLQPFWRSFDSDDDKPGSGDAYEEEMQEVERRREVSRRCIGLHDVDINLACFQPD